MSGPEAIDKLQSVFGGPAMEPGTSLYWRAVSCDCGRRREGAHYNTFGLNPNDDAGGMEALRSFFPDGEASDLNLVLFSTSGVHGSYTTLEEVEASLRKYGGEERDDDDCPDDYCLPRITFLVVEPRIVALRYGNAVDLTLEDVAFLKKLRASSHAALAKIGTEDPST